MPVNPTYPGVYLEEVPSGVRTITGVSTSVTAFVGSAKRGPVNKAVHITSYAEFERRFGGLLAGAHMTYAVRQFFLNGGSDAWVVRVAKSPVAATRTIQDGAKDVLEITALDEGKDGNAIQLRVDYETSNPASTFNLQFSYSSKENPLDDRTESYLDLSMNSKDARYVEDVVNGTSSLVKVQRIPNLAVAGSGTSVSGILGDVLTLLEANHNQLRISVNGAEPIDVPIDLGAVLAGNDAVARLAALCADIGTKVQAEQSGAGFTCVPNAGNDGIIMTSGVAGETSSVRVLGGVRNDAAGRLKLGTANGGVETDAAATIRPKEIPDHGILTSGALALADVSAPNGVPRAGNNCFEISIDGYGPDTVDIGSNAAAGQTKAAKLTDIATRIETAVRAIKPLTACYDKFKCVVSGADSLLLSSGSRGLGSSVVVTATTGDGLAAGLKLLTGAGGAVAQSATNLALEKGNELPFSDAEAFNIFIASRADRKGIYALQDVDLFNLLCLPGVTDSGILMDAESYCRERRAFLIADVPITIKAPSEMSKHIAGTALPKTDYGAVYYPWIKAADPLKGGKPDLFPPSGTIAGLYARTDVTRGVWKAPAGTEATLSGVQGVAYVLTDGENGALNPLGVNCIRIFPVFGVVAWGARTLRGADQMTSEYKYVPIRRLALFIEETLYRNTKWVVFEPNDEPLWAQIRLTIGAFMHTLFRQGAFQGTTPRDAYFVKCDKETTTQDDRNKGIVNIVVGFAPLKPAEFVIIKIQQMAGQIQA